MQIDAGGNRTIVRLSSSTARGWGIFDSGDGLPPDRLMALNRGVGLDNTRSRLEHLYHARYQFTFSNLERGFCVTIRIPFQIESPTDVEVGVV